MVYSRYEVHSLRCDDCQRTVLKRIAPESQWDTPYTGTPEKVRKQLLAELETEGWRFLDPPGIQLCPACSGGKDWANPKTYKFQYAKEA